MKNSLFIVILFITFQAALSGKAETLCRQVIATTKQNSANHDREIEHLENVFDEDFGTGGLGSHSDLHTVSVKTVKITDDYVVLTRLPGRSWQSKAILVPGSLTIQGDPRSVIALLGPRLAKLFGFKLFLNSQNQAELWVPRAHIIEENLKKINADLISKGYDPIAYVPKSAGLLKAEEFLQMGSQKDGDFELAFPYADADAVLAAHEIAYHIGAIVLPHVVLQRAREINHRIYQIVQLLKKHPRTVELTKVIEQLMIDRSVELDTGTGNPHAMLADERIEYISLVGSADLVSYRQMSELASPEVKNLILHEMNFLAVPGFTPTEVALLRLLRTMGLEGSPEYKAILNGRNPPQILISPKFGVVHQLPQDLQKQIVKEILPSLIPNIATESRMSPIDSKFVLDWIVSLDLLIERMEKALSPAEH
jgi:hypothetical protein